MVRSKLITVDGDHLLTSITVSTSGSYNLTVFDGNCTWVSNSVSLSNFATPVPTLSDKVLDGKHDVLNAEPGLINIVWSTGETTSSISVDTTACSIIHLPM